MMSFYLSGGVEVLGFISPTEPTDEYPVIDPLYGIDGFRNVNTLSDLNTIPSLRRRAGMVVGVSGGTEYYKLNPSPWNGSITDWSIFNSGSGGGTFTGGTVTGDTIFTQGVTATTFSATTYLGLPLDVYVTGGTYSNGAITFLNNSGGTFDVTGLYTGETSYINSLTTGVGLSGNTTTGNITLINTAPDKTVTISGGTNVDVTGSYPNFIIDVTGVTSSDTYVTGGTFNKNTEILTLNRNDGNDVQVTGFTDIYTTGFTFDSSTYDISVELNDGTILTQNLSVLASDVTITGGTYDPLNGSITFVNNTGGTFTVTGFITGFTDIQVTGYTYQDNTFTISDSSGNTFNATIDIVTGLTVNGDLTVTGNTIVNSLSATTYQNLPLDVYVTGGTYSNGTITFTNNSGDTFNVTGLYTGETSYVNSLTTGTGLSADTTTGDITIINTNPDQIVSISGGTGILTGGTYPNFTIENSLPDQTVVLNNGSNISVTGIYPNFTVGVTGLTDNDRYVTGFTYQNNTFTISDNSGSTFNATINTVTGLTINGNETINNGKLTINQNNGVIGVDVVNSTEAMVQVQNNPTEFSIFGRFTGETYIYSSLLVPIVFYTNGNNKRMVIDSIGNVGVGTTSPLTKLHVSGNTLINGSLTATTISAATYQNLPLDVYTTGGTYSAGTITFNNSNGTNFSVTGITSSTNLKQTLFVDPNGNDSTATKGDILRPYLTLEAAKSASTSGDTIYVFPGTYTVTTTATEGLAKDGIAYYFSPDTIINKATAGDIFRANGFIYGFNVYGYGNFNKTTNTGSIFSSNNILVYGSVTTYGSLVAGSGYTTGLKTTTTSGAGTGLVVNVTSINAGGGITALSISNAGATYKVGDVITIVGGVTPATITVTAIVADFNSDADISFEANDLYITAASNVFDIRSTARFTTKFNNLLSTSTGGGFYIESSNVNVNMYSIVISNGRSFGGGSGSLGGSSSSNIIVNGYLISSTGNINASTISLSAGSTGTFNVNYITYSGTGGYAFGGNSSTVTLNVSTITSIYGQALSTAYLNGYSGSIFGALNLYGGQVGVVNGITSGDIDTTYFGTRANGAGVLITVSGGNVRLQMQNQDTTTGFAISGGIVTLNGTWTNDDMNIASDLTGGSLIINGDYEYGGPYYNPSRFYGINVSGGTLTVNGTIRINMPSTTAGYSLDASPIQYTSGKIILNGAILISNVPQATPIRAITAGLSIKVYTGGMNTNLIQNGGTLAGKKKKIKYTLSAIVNTQLQLNDNIGSGNVIFTANATTYPSLAQLAQQMVTVINANAIQVTASQDSVGVDTYFYVESDAANLGFTGTGAINLTDTGLVPGMYPLSQSVLGPIIEDTDVE